MERQIRMHRAKWPINYKKINDFKIASVKAGGFLFFLVDRDGFLGCFIHDLIFVKM